MKAGVIALANGKADDPFLNCITTEVRILYFAALSLRLLERTCQQNPIPSINIRLQTMGLHGLRHCGNSRGLNSAPMLVRINFATAQISNPPHTINRRSLGSVPKVGGAPYFTLIYPYCIGTKPILQTFYRLFQN
jgi:hypothetical protein